MSRIVQLANFYGAESGGLRRVVDGLARGYRRAGHESILIVPGDANRDEETRAGRRITLRSPVLPGSGGYRVIASRSRVASVLAELCPDRIEVSDKLTLAWVGRWAADRGVPAVLLSHERLDAILSVRVPGLFPLRTVTAHWNRRLAGSFDTVVCASAFGAEEFTSVGSAVRYVPLGVDLDCCTPAVRPAVTAEAHEVELVTLGRLSAEKRPELAIDALRRLRAQGVDAALVMIGAGPMRRALEARAERLPVTFTGHVDDRAEIARLLARAHVGLAPCPVEAFGLGVLETLACGTPVVVADGGAAPELIDPRCGRAGPPTPSGLASAVRSVLELPEWSRRQAARRRAEQYPWQATVDRMLAVHQLRVLVRA